MDMNWRLKTYNVMIQCLLQTSEVSSPRTKISSVNKTMYYTTWFLHIIYLASYLPRLPTTLQALCASYKGIYLS